MKQNVVSPEAAEEVVPAVIVVIADANSGLPTRAAKTGSFRDVGERAVAIVLVETRSRSFARGPFGVEARSVGQINVEPAVMIVIEEGEAATLRFDDVLLVIDTAPNIGRNQAGFASHVDELDGRGCGSLRNGWMRNWSSFKVQRVAPFPERRGERFQK